MRDRLCFVVAALGLTLNAAAVFAQGGQPPVPLTLEAAIARALQSNRTLIAARLQTPVARAAVGVAKERLNPDVTFEASRDAPKQAIGFSLPIELGNKRARRTDLAEAGVSAADADLARTIAEVQSDVRRAYFTLAAAERQLTFATDTQALAIRVRDTIATRVAAGEVPRLDLVQANIGLGDIEQDVTAARGEAASARAELNGLLGEPPESPITAIDLLDASPLPVLADLLATVRTSNAVILAIDQRIAEQQARRSLAVAMRKPDLSTGAAVTYLAEPEFSVGYRFSAGITVPLFTTHSAGVALEDAELIRLRAERESVLASAEAAVTSARFRAAAAREQLVHFEADILPSILQAEQMAQAGYTAGQTPLLTLLTALQQGREGRKRNLQTALDYQMALADLEKALGARIR